MKICGVRSLDEARLAVELGADALGFNFWPGSRRYISSSAAREVIESLSPFVCPVGVFVNADPQEIHRVASETGLNTIQLHGDETPEYCTEFGSLKTIKAVRVGDDFDPSRLADYPVGAILLDTGLVGHYGGTGVSFDWKSAVQAKEFAQIILAGGLTVETVGDAIRTVQPMAVDVCSGVEAEPGRKDFAKMSAFFREVRRANVSIEDRNSAVNEEGGSDRRQLAPLLAMTRKRRLKE